ncbi:cache domain-containing protein [Leucothrix pacifica]|uniref:histidine kinase n=1 Tax=Leucothrix pacifica TaxID=1247513 RepID=A0A317CBZ9_9GAMM|nr:cache domain-containing protein [Leucothrix pacifica]PWQ95631.1 histidine kinase [Leucothrix pacifica]
MKLSLGVILAIYLTGLQLIAVISVVLISYVSSENVLIDHTRSLLSDTGHNVIDHSKDFLEPARSAAELAKRLTETDIVDRENADSLEKLLFQQLKTTSQFSGMFYGDESGNFVYVMRSDDVAEYRTKVVRTFATGQEASFVWRDPDYNVVEREVDPLDVFDPRTRPWYRSAKESKDFIWTDPYIFFSSQKPGITAAVPVMEGDGTVSGVFGVDIEIEALSDFLAQLKIGQNGVAMILTRQGNVIAHPNSELIKVKNKEDTLEFVNITDINDEIVQAAFGELAQSGIASLGQEAQSEFEHDGYGYVSTVIPAYNQELPWAIAIYAPTEDFIGGIKANRIRNIWIAVFIALITGLIGLKVADRINRPVRDFASLAVLLSSGEVSTSDDIPETYRELKQASQTLLNEVVQRKAFEREYGVTFDLASRGMAQISPNTGRFIRTNAHFNDILGFTAKEMQGMKFSDILHPDDTDTYISFQYAVHKNVEYNQERRYLRKDGTIAWLRVNAILIRDEDGKPLHTVATIDDVTSLKLSEEKINELSRELSHFSRINMMGQMATGLAHELNQPLTAITQNADAALLTVSQSANPDPELIEILEEMEEQAHRGADIIRALRGFIRKEKGDSGAYDLNELIEQTLCLVHPEASVRGINILFKAQALPNAIGSRVQVAQVIVNLLRNAIEAIVVAELPTKRIEVRAEANNGMIKVAVEDTGCGVDPDIDLFTQFETSKQDGMGLGLAFSRSIIEANGGKLWCEPETEHSTKFCFTLPVLSMKQLENDNA